MSQRIPRRRVLAKAIVALAAAGDCLAADRSWGNTGGGTFSTGTNWIDGLIAGTNDVAIFSRSRGASQTTYTVSFSANAQNQSAFVGPDIVTFALGGRTYTTTAITGNEIGTSTAFTSRLTVQNGVFNMTGALTPQLLVGGAAGRVGSLILTNNATLNGAPNLLIGTASATGFVSLNGLSGGTATSSLLDIGRGAGGRGTVNVSGPFAAFTSGSLLLGNAGIGTMLIDIAGVYTNNGSATIGNLAGSSGQMTVDGTSRWSQQNGTLIIGNAGAGSLIVANGGSLSGSIAVLGAGTTGTATVRVGGPASGSRWTNTGALTIADFGNATLTVDGGGFVSAGTTIIGRSAASAGTLNIDSGASVSFGRLFVGNSGTATVNITGGGVLNAGTTVMSTNDGGTCTFNVAGANSAANFPRLTLADTGATTVNVTDGGRLICSGDTDIGFTFGNPTAFGRVNVGGNGSRWINAGKITLYSGQGNAINITGGGTVECSSADIGGDAGLTVDGVGSRWVNNGSLNLDADMTISNGGVVDNTNASAAVHVRTDSFSRVQGAGSAWNIAGPLEVGFFDSFLLITAGGKVQAANTLIKTDGTISLSSSGSDLTTGNLTLGFGTNSGGENLFVQFGADLHTQSAKLAGHNSSINLVSSATVRDFGSTWQNTGSLIVGGDGAASFTGDGRLDVLNSGSVSNGDAFIAFSPGSTGTVSVSGATSFSIPATWTTNGNLSVGGSATADGGAGELRVLTGGLVVVTDTLTLRDAGLVDLDGGTLTVGSILGDLALIFQSGTLNITTQNPQIGAGSPLDGIGYLSAGCTINVANATTILPAGTLRMGGGRYISSGGITNDGKIDILVGRTATFLNPIVNNGQILNAAGTTIEFSSSLSGPGVFVGPGTKVFKTGSNAVVGSLDTAGQTVVQTGATLRADSIRESSLTVQSSGIVNINPGGTDASTSRLNSLTMTIAGRLDLADNALVIDYTAASPSALVETLLTSGFAGGSWNGNGINSSVAATQANRALGFAEATDLFSSFPATFAGEAIDSTAILVRFTLPGDSNLDQIVNISDFATVAANFNGPSSWPRGDFNYDSVTNIADFSLLAANFNQTLPLEIPRQSVPEPVAAQIVAAVCFALRRVRRCR